MGHDSPANPGDARGTPPTTLQPLSGMQVLDFSTLLPGPMCSLLLREAGADILKVERPDTGDEMRSYTPKFGQSSANFAMLNRGKGSVSLDLKSAEGRTRALELAQGADILIEQFRPGVMDRLGLGYDTVKAVNPRIIYCSITGFGQTGPLAERAAHDVNYVAEAGMLPLCASSEGELVLPHALLADLGGGAYPAMMNILLALRSRDLTGVGCRLDVAMCENLFTYMYWALGEGFSANQWPHPRSGLVTGGSPRYQLYRTKDGRFLAAAPLEDKFWANFLRVLEAEHLLDDAKDPQGTWRAVAAIVASRTSEDWLERFDGVDACVNLARTLEEAVAHPHFAERGVFSHGLLDGAGRKIPALPIPIARHFRKPVHADSAPILSK